jgi:hypothetical protein
MPATVRRSRSGGPARLERSGDAPYFDPKEIKMIARANTSRNFPVPNDDGSRPGGVVFTGLNLRHKGAPRSAPWIGSPTYASRSSKTSPGCSEFGRCG